MITREQSESVPAHDGGSDALTCGLSEAANTQWDAAVIGAGPAGAAAAIVLARAGRRVLMVDRVAHPRDKVCGCCLGPLGQRVITELGAASVLDGAGCVAQVSVAAGGRAVRLGVPAMAVIGRDVLDDGLIACARRAGASVLWPVVARVVDGLSIELDLARCGVAGRGGARGGERGVVVRPRVTLVCDGLAGSSDRKSVV